LLRERGGRGMMFGERGWRRRRNWRVVGHWSGNWAALPCVWRSAWRRRQLLLRGCRLGGRS
jgi:hypothetical protein